MCIDRRPRTGGWLRTGAPTLFAAGVVLAAATLTARPTAAAPAEVTLIHMGDVHGHLVARPSAQRGAKTFVRSGAEEGGLARMYTRIQEIRKRRGQDRTLLLNTGDTIQGSAEALFTRGQAMVDVLNKFGIDVYAPGNWEWVYGVDRFRELFAGDTPKAPWTTLAANAYFDGEPYADRMGQRVLPPTHIKIINGVKIGFLGFTTDRGPQVVGRGVTKGVRFTKGDEEVAQFVKQLRETDGVDIVVMLSELGLANNIRLAEKTPGIDVILSSDMHEITLEPVIVKTGTRIVEAGQDGQVLGEMTLNVDGKRVVDAKWTLHRIDQRVREDEDIADLIDDIRVPFVKGPGFRTQVNPFNGTQLSRPIDTIVGRTAVPLHRTGFTTDAAPAVLEGTSHALLTDAFRAETGAMIGAIRGFRYGTVVTPGPIRVEDLYHFIPIGPMIATGKITGKQLKGQIEGAADGSLNPDVSKWTGGWLFNFSGVRMTIDASATTGQRAKGIEIEDPATKTWKPLDPEATYTYASYFYQRDPDLINVVPATDISVLKGENGQPLDGVEVVVRYLEKLRGKAVSPEMGRIKAARPLPASITSSPQVQPWRGAPAAAAPQPATQPAPQPATK